MAGNLHHVRATWYARECLGGFSPLRRAALAVLTGLNFLNYVDRFIPAAVMPSIIAALHLKDSQAGSLSTLFILSYSLVSPVAGWLADRKPRFQLAAVGVFVWSLATFGSGLAPTFLALVVARALTGVGEASYVVVTPSLVSDYYPPARRGRALAIFYAAIPVGSALGYVLGGAINARFGWRWAFFLAGAPGAALAFALLFLRDPPRGAMDVAKLPTTVPAALPATRRRRQLSLRRRRSGRCSHPQLSFQHGGADHLHLRGRGAGDLDADLLRARAPPAARLGRPDVRRRAGGGGPGGDADRRAARRSHGGAPSVGSLPAVRRHR